MRVDLEAAEMVAEACYGRAGMTVRSPANAVAIARRILGPSCVRRVPARIESGFALLDGLPTILVGDDVPIRRAHFHVAWRLMRLMMGRDGWPCRDVDRLSEIAAAALIAPRRAFLESRLSFNTLAELARFWCLEEASIVLRIAETTLTDAAVVDPTHVRTRLLAGLLPDDESDVRQWACADLLPRHVRRLVLGDAPHRVALLAA